MARSPVPKVTEHGITVVFEAENPTIEYVPSSRPPLCPLRNHDSRFLASLIVAAAVSSLSTASPVTPKELGHWISPPSKAFR